MIGTALGVYLNDHFAGSVSAVELLRHWEATQPDHPATPTLIRVREEIVKDQNELERLIRALNITFSAPRRVSAWLTEKMTEAKLVVDDPGDGGLRRLEMLEVLALGITGKRALWAALDASAAANPALRQLDYDRLSARADEQRRIVEELRIDAAKAALTSGR